MKTWRLRRLANVLLLALVLLLAWATLAQAVPQIRLDVDNAGDPSSLPLTLRIVLLLTVLSLAPALAVLMTSFTRIVVVLSFLKHAMGVQSAPPSQVLVGLALFLTVFIMAPTAKQVNDTALQPLLAHQITDTEAWQRAAQPVRAFMLHQTRVKDLEMFASLAGVKNAPNADAVPLYAVVPAFVVSELTTAFQIGFMLFIPFLVIDMVVASVLMSMGMMMLPPVMISMPFKILLFVLVDGWHLIVQSLVTSFN